MEFALSEKNERIVASTKTKGYCTVCKEPMTPKCGDIKRHHWAHKSKTKCDPWWEGETDWHRQWKNFVEGKFREIVIIKDGIKHRADVQLPSGYIFEFQKKPLSLDARQAREKFYDKMIWVIHFSKDKLLEIETRKKYYSLYGDVIVKVKSFSEGFFRPPHPCPIFLDFNDDEMFWIKEFDDYDNMRARWFYGRFISKMEFINRYFKAPFDIEELKISHYHQDIEKKQKQLWAAQEELLIIKEQLLTAKQQKHDEEYYKRNDGLQNLQDDENRKQHEKNNVVNKVKSDYTWGVWTELDSKAASLEAELKKQPKKEPWED